MSATTRSVPQVAPHVGQLQAFFARLSQAQGGALLLDYDGTLAPFQVRPQLARPYPGIPEVLDAIAALGRTRLIVFSGRRVEELASLLGGRRRPELWGADGCERLMPDGRLEISEPRDALRGLAEARRSSAPLAALGARIELKPAAVAVHWRGLPAIAVAQASEKARREWEPLLEDPALELVPFDGGLELVAREVGRKRAAVGVIESLEPALPVAYLGDDENDEDVFRALHGRGLSVLVRASSRETAADVTIRPPPELLAFLKRWNEAVRAA